tara:strand:- start:50798 stop:51379 length:582 start_codon:yes stop_codon:yes gene_type:complete
MSSIFSDPFWRRGSTLLTGEPIELDASSNPVAGTEVIGQVKAFQDVSPTGHGTRHSNKLVYCVAVRYLGSTVADVSTIAGVRYALDGDQTTITSARTKANADAFKPSGILDEYLTGELRQNDIVWLVVKGPCEVKTNGSSSIAAGDNVVAGSVAGETVKTGTGGASSTVDGTALAASASAAVKGRVNLHCNFI